MFTYQFSTIESKIKRQETEGGQFKSIEPSDTILEQSPRHTEDSLIE